MVTDMHQRKAEMAIHFLIQNAEQRHSPADVDQSSMLKVICNQRHCFRARLRETEELDQSSEYFASSELYFSQNPATDRESQGARAKR